MLSAVASVAVPSRTKTLPSAKAMLFKVLPMSFVKPLLLMKSVGEVQPSVSVPLP